MYENDGPTKINRFDQVRIVTTKNVNYLSAPSGSEASPGGIWSVAGSVDGDLLLVKNNLTIRITVADVLKIADCNLEKITRNLGRLSSGKGCKEK